jgi:hypothetical protein
MPDMWAARSPPATQVLGRALIACETLLQEAIEGQIAPTEWSIEDLQALRDQLEAALASDAGGSGGFREPLR